MKGIITVALFAIVAVGCDRDNAGNGGPGDTASRFERGMERVGEKIGTAAEGVQTEVNEARIQAVIDNIKGMDNVQAEIGNDGAVTLIGTVATAEASTQAEMLVRSIEGVTIVRNAISVAGGTDTNVVHDPGPNADSGRRQPDTTRR
jgi:osmotically-inducible protein OsmY